MIFAGKGNRISQHHQTFTRLSEKPTNEQNKNTNLLNSFNHCEAICWNKKTSPQAANGTN